MSLSVWYDVGIAVHLSTIDIEKGKLRVGFPAGGRWANLHAPPWMPLRAMFNATRSTEVYTSHRAAAACYAQSSALVHYIALAGGDATKVINLMIAYIDRGLSAGQSG